MDWYHARRLVLIGLFIGSAVSGHTLLRGFAQVAGPQGDELNNNFTTPRSIAMVLTRFRLAVAILVCSFPLMLMPWPLANAQNTQQGYWTTEAPMPTPRFKLAAATGPDGRC